MSVDELAAALQGYLSASQLGNQLGVSTEWARRLVQAGAVDAIHTANGWLIEPTSAARLVAERAAARMGIPSVSVSPMS
jgi:hypothetical protein